MCSILTDSVFSKMKKDDVVSIKMLYNAILIQSQLNATICSIINLSQQEPLLPATYQSNLIT